MFFYEIISETISQTFSCIFVANEIHMEQESAIRLNKYLTEVGFCSRREADKLIEAGKVTINGSKAQLGQKVNPSDIVHVLGKEVANKDSKAVYLALNKPVGIVCTTDRGVEKDNIIDFVNFPSRIFPIGRLDKASEGLIFLTNDGDIVNKILRAGNQHEKEYIVTVDKPITKEFIQRMRDGVPILDTITKRCFVKQTHKKTFKIVLTQGLNRQIRRMCEYLGYRVVKLQRTRIMNINLDLAVGKWRHLTASELKTLKNQLIHSSKTTVI